MSDPQSSARIPQAARSRFKVAFRFTFTLEVNVNVRSDRAGLAADPPALTLADLAAIEHGHVSRPGVTRLAAREPEEVRLTADEQIDLVPVEAAGVIGDDAPIVDEAAPRVPARHPA